jgi:Sulfotransferase family
MAESKLPDLVIIGAMKSATSTLYHWLSQQPEVFMASPKETNFFARDWDRGLDWYRSFFDGAEAGQLLGEASVMYTSPEHAEASAERMKRVIPDARLIYVIREPVERIRSHYRHEVQRHRETRPLLDAIGEPGNSYLGNSMYFARLEPYIANFSPERLLVVRFEDVVRQPWSGWDDTLALLGMSSRPSPDTAHNVTAENAQWTGALLWLRKHGIFNFGRAAKLPTPVRRLGKRLLTRGGETFRERLDDSTVEIPSELVQPVWEDLARLEGWLGREQPLWPRTVAVTGDR